MIKFLKTTSVIACMAALTPIANAGTPNAYQSDEELAMVDKKPQPGQLTAGDYDDILNPELFKLYVDEMLQDKFKGHNLPYVDTKTRIDIHVVDSDGKDFPLADISLKDNQGEKELKLRTGANGMSYIYPNYDEIAPDHVLSVTVDAFETVDTEMDSEIIAEGGRITVSVDAKSRPIDKVDLLLTFDATGSMGDEMRYLKAEFEAIVEEISLRHPHIDMRHGLIVYRDKGDEYVVKDFPFTDDLGRFQNALNKQKATGGGDMPEAMHTALQRGLTLDWREDALKVNLLVADAPPHNNKIYETWDAGIASRNLGIHIVPLAGSGVDKTAEYMMRNMAHLTKGRYLFLTDDSGIGNAHAEPTVDCYVVTHLDGLVTRVLDGLITGERQEPDTSDIIRRVGNYQAGRCKIDQQ